MDDRKSVNEYSEDIEDSPKDDEHCEDMEHSSKDNSDCENAFQDQSSKSGRNPTTLANQILSAVGTDASANEQSLSGTWSTTHNKSPTKAKTRKSELSESHTSPPTPSIKKRKIMKSSSDDSETANNALQSSVVFSTSTADTDSKSPSNLVTQESEVAVTMVEASIYHAGEKTLTSFGDSWTDSNSPAKLSNPDDLYQTRSFINVPTKEHGTTMHSIMSTGDSIASANVDSENQRKGSTGLVSNLVEPGSSDPEFKSRPIDKVSGSGFEPTSNPQNSNTKDCKPCIKEKTQEFQLISSEETQSVSNIPDSGIKTAIVISSESDEREGEEVSDEREEEDASDERQSVEVSDEGGEEEASDEREEEEVSDEREEEEVSDGNQSHSSNRTSKQNEKSISELEKSLLSRNLDMLQRSVGNETSHDLSEMQVQRDQSNFLISSKSGETSKRLPKIQKARKTCAAPSPFQGVLPSPAFNMSSTKNPLEHLAQSVRSDQLSTMTELPPPNEPTTTRINTEVLMQGGISDQLKKGNREISSESSLSAERSEVDMDIDPHIDVSGGEHRPLNESALTTNNPEGSCEPLQQGNQEISSEASTSAKQQQEASMNIDPPRINVVEGTYQLSRGIFHVRGLLLAVLGEIMEFNEDEEWWKRIVDMFDTFSKSPREGTKERIEHELYQYMYSRRLYLKSKVLFTYLEDNYAYYIRERFNELLVIVCSLVFSTLTVGSSLDWTVIMEEYKKLKSLYELCVRLFRNNYLEGIEISNIRNKMMLLERMMERLLLQMRIVFQLFLMLFGKHSEKKIIDQFVEELWEEDKVVLRRQI